MKTIISLDVELDEERQWDWGLNDEDYNFFPHFEEEDAEQPRMKHEREELTAPLTS